MPAFPASSNLSRFEIAALSLMIVALPLIIKLHLLPALFAGLLVHELVHILAPRMFGVNHTGRAKLAALVLLLVVIVTVLGLAVTAVVLFLRSDVGSVGALLEKMAEILDKARESLPEAVRESIPVDAGELKNLIVEWLRCSADSSSMPWPCNPPSTT